MEKTFIDKCINGEALPGEIDDYIDKWHDGIDINRSLYQFLGMTPADYNAWITTPSLLLDIIEYRKQKKQRLLKKARTLLYEL